MERIRADLLRRARMERQGDDIQLEDAQSTCQNATQEADDSQASRRPFISRLFNRRPRGQDEEAGGGAKTADSLFRSFYFPSRNHRPNPPDSNPTPGGPSTPAQTVDSIPSQSNESSLPATPAPVAIATWRTISQSNGRRSRRTPLDPAEVLLAEFAADVRERRRARQQGTSRRKHPRRFLCCFPWIKSRRIRAQILRCFVSGLFLVLLLCICKFGPRVLLERSRSNGQADLLLSMTKNINSSEMTIMLILVIIFGTVFFCHGLIRLVLLCMKGDREQVARPRACRAHASRGYAVPSRPIPVVLARDEEACGVESEASKMEPPAYGMWRESVVSWTIVKNKMVGLTQTFSVSIQIDSFGSGTRQPSRCQRFVKSDLVPGHHHISQKTEFHTSSRPCLDQLHQQQMSHFRHIRQKLDELQERRRCNYGHNEKKHVKRPRLITQAWPLM